ncbi:zinc finger BED domain-containing protein RICESLEEPER 4-like [Helianthus annuus]|uniref:zinc finger BED domain-containing protein RICESLEEPER 4-like n=1 Tax=Helianthus annuus TaxID=4232 RepID=UPI000B8FF0AF|nr:zinc finger BED domain-containing protein RICESLEEPER 4-like [Helianthus annuus]
MRGWKRRPEKQSQERTLMREGESPYQDRKGGATGFPGDGAGTFLAIPMRLSSKMSDCQLPYDDIEFQRSKDTLTKEKMANIDDVIVVNDEEENAHVNETTNRVEQQNNDEEDAPYTKRKRRKTSNAWVHFRTISNASGSEVPQCIHCGEKLKKLKDGTTTPLLRHINTSCPKLKAVNKGQLKLNVGFGNSTESSSLIQNWKFSNARMREVISHMIMVHELPFNFIEYELFNMLMKEANPAFNKISRASIRQDCISSYEIGKKRTQKPLNTVNRVSITTDMWTSVQNIHYMVVTCHFVDLEFNLHKSILSFVDVPLPYSGVRIYDCLFKCLKDWNIETKVATLTD